MKRNIFDLALEFYHSPVEHPELMDAAVPLPLDIGCLLDAISENKDPNLPLESSGELSADLRTAISFFIERSFFVPGADCYRVLGLSIGARADQVRKHYNQLLHIFSLDRLDKSGEWDAAFATQITRAYSVLRDAERRRAYDQMLMRPAVVRESIEPVREEHTEIAGAAKSTPKVSYLGSTRPAEEKQAQGNQGRVLKGASVAGDRAMAFERTGSASNSSLKSSFIANRIDRASGIATDSDIRDLSTDQESVTADESLQAESESVGNAQEHFPVGIPASGPRASVSSRNRFLSMDRSSLVLLVAVILVLIVYAVVLPGRFMGQSDSAPDKAVSDQATNGNVIRENAAGGSDVATVASPTDPEDVNIPAHGNDAHLSKSQGEVSVLAEIAPDSEIGKESQSDSALEHSSPKSDNPQVMGATGDDQRTQKVPAKPVALLQQDRAVAKTSSAPDKGASNSKKIEGQATGLEAASPAKKLESMRQTLQKQPEADSHTAGTHDSRPEARQVAKAEAAVPRPAQAKSAAQPVARSTAAQPTSREASKIETGQAKEMTNPASSTSLTVPPPASNLSIAGPGTVASIAPVTSISQPQGITISELNGLVDTFSRAYELGDLDLLLTLFSNDARTNDQSSKAGIAKDYQDLFEVSGKRRFVIDRLRWEQDKAGALKGEGDFQADVQLRNNNSVTSVKGKVIFYVKRGADGIVITQMLHSYN